MNKSLGFDPIASRRVAVFVDFENIKRAVDDFFAGDRVDLKRVLDEVAQVTQGRIVVKRAYADWSAFREYRTDLLETATEAVQAFPLTQKGKNGADIRLTVDVIEAVLRQPELTHVVIVSGNSDFTPLAMRLRELGQVVIGIGVRANTSSYLTKSCDRFIYYDELGETGGRNTGLNPSQLLTSALSYLGNRPVPGSALKIQIRKMDPSFDETRLGFSSFLEFLRANGDLVDVFKPVVGDVTVAPVGQLADGPLTEGAVLTPMTPADALAERYKLWLRDNNFRYVPPAEREEIIRVLFDIFVDAEEGEGISLKEAKEQLHAWFETHKPDVSWDAINSTVYHLFYTWCFSFDKTEEGEAKQLWDRRTNLHDDIETSDDLIDRVERGIIRKLWERDRVELDAEALNVWLYDGNPERLDRVKGLIETATAATTAVTPRPGLG